MKLHTTGHVVEIPETTRPGCAVIALNHVTRQYRCDTGVVRALDDATFSIVAGEWVAVTGPSGSGKSTLVNLIGCLDRPTGGELKIDNVDVATMSATEMDRFRADKIGFIFQQFHLIPYLSALENVMLAQYFHSMTDEGEAKAALERVGIASSQPVVGRRAAAGLHCACTHQRPSHSAGRRADRESGRSQPDHRRGAVAGPPRERPHHRDGDARPGDGRAGAAEDRAEPRQGLLPSGRRSDGHAARQALIRVDQVILFTRWIEID